MTAVAAVEMSWLIMLSLPVCLSEVHTCSAFLIPRTLLCWSTYTSLDEYVSNMQLTIFLLGGCLLF